MSTIKGRHLSFVFFLMFISFGVMHKTWFVLACENIISYKFCDYFTFDVKRQVTVTDSHL